MQATEPEARYLTYSQAEVYCGLHRTTLWRAARKGVLRVSGPEAAPRFHTADLDAWMRSRNR
jgi:predicted DNA-binding transcriptional regulator AlpA